MASPEVRIDMPHYEIQVGTLTSSVTDQGQRSTVGRRCVFISCRGYARLGGPDTHQGSPSCRDSWATGTSRGNL
jgi:hypothetical protein